MRKGECAALKLDDIDWKKGILRVDNTLDFQPEEGDHILGDTKTYRSNRNIKMKADYMQKLKTYIKYQSERKLHLGSLYNGELNLLFAREDGSPLPKSTLYNTFKAALEHISIDPLPIHSTRHTHAVMLLEAGWSMKAIQERLGHESMQTTADIYAHISENFEQKSMDKFDDFMKSREK